MKKILVLLSIAVMASGAWAADYRAGLIAGATAQMEPMSNMSVGGGGIYGMEFGVIFNKIQVWPRVLADISWTQNQMLMASINPGLEVVLFDRLGIAAGAVFRMNNDYKNTVEVPGFGSFPTSTYGVGPLLEVSYLFNLIEDYLVLRPSISVDYVFMAPADQFRIRAAVYLHTRSDRF